MKVLVLSCSTGQGHEAAAEAIAEEFVARGIPAEQQDVLKFAEQENVPKIVKDHIVNDTYNYLVMNHPLVFKKIFQIGEFVTSPRHKSPMYLANSTYAGNLAGYIRENGVDTVICTHMFPAEALTSAMHHGLNVHSYAVATDYVCLPFWEECSVDRYLVSHQAVVPLFTRRGIPTSKVVALGLPIARRFRESIAQDEARRMLALPADGPLYLILTGSMGFGDISELPGKLNALDPEATVVVIAGTNEALHDELATEYHDARWFHVVGFTHEIATYMDACDVVITKPGGLSSTEAAAKGKPIVHTPAIPGFEARNGVFFSKRGMSVFTQDYDEAAQAAFELVHDASRRMAMIAAQHANIDASASERICDYIVADASQHPLANSTPGRRGRSFGLRRHRRMPARIRAARHARAIKLQQHRRRRRKR